MRTILLLLFIGIIYSNNIFTQTSGDYKTAGGGLWTEISTWEYYNGSEWIPSATTPTSSSGNITILSGHQVTLSSSVTVDQLIVASGGELYINTSGTFNVNDGTGDDVIVNGTLTLLGSVNGAGSVIINGICNWNESGFNNSNMIRNTNFNIASGGNLVLNTGGGAKWISGGRIYNSGTITMNSNGGELHGVNGAQIHNQSDGIFDLTFDGKIYSSMLGGHWDYGFTLSNAGTLKKSGGTGTGTIEHVTFTNTGTVLLQNGTLDLKTYNSSPGHTGEFTLSSGTTLIFTATYNTSQSLGEGSIINGTGTVQAKEYTLNLAGTTNGTTLGSGINLEFISGTITGGNGKATVNGTMDWSGGTFSGTLYITENASLTLSGTSGKSSSGGKIYNSGTITWSGGNFANSSSALFYNQSSGLFDIQCDATFSNYDFYSYTGSVTNEGVIKKTLGSGNTTFDRGSVANSGTIEINTGAFLFNSYISLNNTGTLKIANDASCAITGTGASLTNFSSNTLNSGTYNIAGTFKFNDANILTNNGTIILDGASSQILNHNDVNALANFTTNGATGNFTLSNGRDFSTSAGTFTNNGTLNCGSNIFSGSGNFNNASGSTLITGSAEGITSSGSSGNIQNSGTRTFSTTANYTYNGTSAQVTGDGLPGNVNNFTINNSNGVTLTSNAGVAGILSLTSGNLNTAANTLTLGTNASSTGTLERTAGKIVGNFKRWIGAETANDILFPIGTTNYYRPANISFTSAPATGGTLTTFFTAGNPGTNGLPLNDGEANIQNVGQDGYWTITTGDGLSGGTYNIDITADGFGGITDYTKLHLLKRENSGSNWTVTGTHIQCTGTIACPTLHRNGLDSFSEFGVGSTSENPLPVELISFNAKINNDRVVLTWQTATEVNNYGFYVERTSPENRDTPLQDFEKVGFVEGHGNSNSTKDYSFVDEPALAGKYFYRLKQIDTDGTFSYSEEVEVEIANIPTDFILYQNYPNPFNPSTKIDYQLPFNSEVKIELFSITGERVAIIVNQQKEAGFYTIELNTSKLLLASGVYIYRIVAINNSNAKTYINTKKLVMLK